jgi:hypothetical protein
LLNQSGPKPSYLSRTRDGLARQAPDDVTRERIENLVVELEQKLREIDA